MKIALEKPKAGVHEWMLLDFHDVPLLGQQEGQLLGIFCVQ